jgi:TrmH family RNA methyltransferase
MITSRHNELIKSARALHNKQVRDARSAYCAEGVRIIATLIQSGERLEQLFYTPEQTNKAQELAGSAELILVSTSVMESLSSMTTPSGLYAVFAQKKAPLSAVHTGNSLVLARIADPGNAGTLIRTAAACGYQNIIAIESVDLWSSKVVQASAGTLGLLHLICTSWESLIQEKKSIPAYALVVTGGKAPCASTEQHLLVIGNEAHGIDPAWVAECEQRVTLPMRSDVESLNAGVAGSLALYLLSHDLPKECA